MSIECMIEVFEDAATRFRRFAAFLMERLARVLARARHHEHAATIRSGRRPRASRLALLALALYQRVIRSSGRPARVRTGAAQLACLAVLLSLLVGFGGCASGAAVADGMAAAAAFLAEHRPEGIPNRNGETCSALRFEELAGGTLLAFEVHPECKASRE